MCIKTWFPFSSFTPFTLSPSNLCYSFSASMDTPFCPDSILSNQATIRCWSQQDSNGKIRYQRNCVQIGRCGKFRRMEQGVESARACTIIIPKIQASRERLNFSGLPHMIPHVHTNNNFPHQGYYFFSTFGPADYSATANVLGWSRGSRTVFLPDEHLGFAVC